jgi:hypothetical protein
MVRIIYKLLAFLYKKLNNIRALIYSFIAFSVIIILMSVISYISMPGKGINTFLLEFAGSQNAFVSIAHQLGPKTIKAYKSILLVDCLFPFAYAVFLGSVIALLSKRKDDGEIRETALFFFALPFLGGILDLIENSIHLYLLGDLSRVTETIVKFATLDSILKWAMPAIATVYIVIILVKLLPRQSFLHNIGSLKND